MPSVVLLGDSILDNRPYVGAAADTAEHLRGLLGGGWTVELLARDGALMADVPRQLGQVQRGTACAVLSVGGNDALQHIGLLGCRASSAVDILEPLAELATGFRAEYESVVAAALPVVERLVLCTIYEAPLADRAMARLATVPLAVLNDQILRVAAERRLDVVELRAVCTEPSDFVLEIEPSAQGARKIATALVAALTARPDIRVGRLFAL
ncbi:MAG TPA: SGNH/GDSL hydrolase family protein [Gemmatimonadaceae bacterium]|nr:SGNH/GDSL hydrolase family protein [Gemmatimonadaceae bacterium]